MAEEDDGGTAAKQPQTTSLFPVLLQPSSGNHDSATEWLQNSSFTADFASINNAASSHYQQQSRLEESSSSGEEERAVKERGKPEGPRYELLNSSPSDRGSHSDGDDGTKEKREKRNKEKKKRRKKELSSATPSFHDFAVASSSSRKSDVRNWVSSDSFTNTKEYYFDSKGDRDNLAFGCLYRMDIARYKVHNSKKISDVGFYRLSHKISVFDGDDDIDGLDGKLRLGGRYWSAQHAALERHRNLKRIRVLPPEKSVSNASADFISLSDDRESDVKSQLGAKLVEESWEDEVYRQTKEFNKLSREKPHDEKVWLAFADFQDRIADAQPQKGARLQTLEKKISILEKATELNPDNEDLILSLMKAYQSRDSTDVLIGRWERILVQNSGSYRLWREFLRFVQGEFSRFKVSEMRKLYANAIQALYGACSKQYRQVQKNTPVDRELVGLELGLVDVFLSLCRFEWQTGYRELATALFQAEIEFALFCPSLLLSEQSKRRLFEHFWSSNGARVGEDGAFGWSTWLGKEEEQRLKVKNEKLSLEAEEGGWTGWSKPPSKNEEVRETQENYLSINMEVEDSDDVLSQDDEGNNDTEALLKKLGIDVAADPNVDIKDTKTWTKWSEEELSRDGDQWMPVRAESGAVAGFPHDADAGGDEQLFRVIIYEDVAEYLFSLTSEEAQLSLVSHFIEFFGGKITQWSCTNSVSWAESIRSLEAFSHTILDELRKVHSILSEKESCSMLMSSECFESSMDDVSMRTSMMKFVRNATLLCLSAFPKNYVLEEAVLVAEELSNTRMGSSTSSVTPCRALAKSLLKNNRQDVLLCGVYARREAAFGNVDQARKIFDMALSSIEVPPSDIQSSASLLYLWYAEVEMANNLPDKSESSSRAVHILSCLGCGVKHSPYRSQPSSLQQLRARQGFKERLRMLGSLWTRGRIDDFSNATICAPALFEELTTGPVAAIEILDQAFSMVLPERRRHSHQLEILLNCYVKILCQYHREMRLSNTWEAIVKGLQMYPLSPQLYGFLVETSHLHTSPNKLRQIFDEFCGKESSLVACFFSLAFEMCKGGSQYRVRSIFERALDNKKFGDSVVLWRWYIAYESKITSDLPAARRVFFRAIHACPWSKALWLDGFVRLNSVLTAKELSDLQEVMRDKELNLRTDIYEILLRDEMET